MGARRGPYEPNCRRRARCWGTRRHGSRRWNRWLRDLWRKNAKFAFLQSIQDQVTARSEVRFCHWLTFDDIKPQRLICGSNLMENLFFPPHSNYEVLKSTAIIFHRRAFNSLRFDQINSKQVELNQYKLDFALSLSFVEFDSLFSFMSGQHRYLYLKLFFQLNNLEIGVSLN